MNTTRTVSKVSVRPENIRPRFLECTNCLYDYDQQSHLPRILSCLHTFCTDCLLTLQTNDTVKCPSCNQTIAIPNSDVTSFPVDKSRNYLINYLNVQNNASQIICEECGTTRKAVNRCKECGEFLCVECTDAHKKTKVTKRHNISNLEDLKESSLEEFQDRAACTVVGHEDQPFSFFCYSKTCDRPVCALCAVREHQESRGHDIRNINDVYTEVKRTVESLLSDVKHRQLSMEDSLGGVEGVVEELGVAQSVVDEEIDAAFDKCQKVIERRRNEMKNKLFTIVANKKKQLHEQLEQLMTHKTNLDDASELATSVSAYSTPPEFLNFKEHIIQRLKELRWRDFDIAPHNNAEIRFKIESVDGQFQDFVKRMGDLWYTSAYLPNTKVHTSNIRLNKEEVPITVSLHDCDGNLQNEGGADIRVEIVDPDGAVLTPAVEDCTVDEGCYKMPFVATKPGKHRAKVFLFGSPIDDLFLFYAGHNDLPELPRREKDIGLNLPKSVTPTDSTLTALTPIDFTHGDVICPDFRYDATVAHNLVEVLEMDRMLKSKSAKFRFDSRMMRHESGRFQNYRGTLGTRSFHKAGLYYYEVHIQYRVVRLVRQGMVFEVGLSRLEVVDHHVTVDCYPYAWAICARGCHICGKICAQTWHNGQLLTHNPLSARTPSTPGTSVKVAYGFLMDIDKRHWIIVDLRNKKVLFHFKNLVVSEFSEPLWPTFAVYNPEQVTVSLNLRTGKDISLVPEEALDALVI
ncbi:hypothetical protein ScPMuIL_016057 [Solemya velum]